MREKAVLGMCGRLLAVTYLMDEGRGAGVHEEFQRVGGEQLLEIRLACEHVNELVTELVLFTGLLLLLFLLRDILSVAVVHLERFGVEVLDQTTFDANASID